MTLEEAIAQAKAENIRNWFGFNTNPDAVATIITAVASGDLIPLTDHRLAVALAEVQALKAERDDCAIYLKDGETPRQRMDRDHADVLSLMEMLAKDRSRREAAEAEVARLRAQIEAADKLAEVLRSKTVMDPGNSNSTWLDAKARAALSAYEEERK